MLAGVIVNNAIVFIDFVNKGRMAGEDIRTSIIQAGGKRIRPLLCLLACHAAGGDWRQAVPAASAIPPDAIRRSRRRAGAPACSEWICGSERRDMKAL